MLLISIIALSSLVAALRAESINIIEAIQAWRHASSEELMNIALLTQHAHNTHNKDGTRSNQSSPSPPPPRLIRLADGTPVSPMFQPYLWHGRNYLMKMLHDTDFVSESVEVVSNV